jgi:hypothetical protein
MRKLLPVLLLLLCPLVFANTPGKHSVTLNWTASTTSGVTYNVYKGSAAGVCTGTPTPYATGVSGTQFIDQVGLSDGQTLFYNVSAVKGGAESACDGEVQVQIPVLPAPPSGVSVVAQ